MYYEAVCRWRQRQLWAFDPDDDNRPYQVDNLPSVMIANEVIGFPYVRVRDWLASASGNVQPATETVSEESYRNMIIRGQPVLASPNGRWRALVAKHIYGPQDVVVVNLSPDSTAQNLGSRTE
jgi:hypothetical protein